MPSFDVVSEIDHHEVENAVNQAKKEVSQRYDFRDTNTTIDKTGTVITIKTSSDAKIAAAYQVLLEKITKRKVSTKSLDPQSPEAAGGGTWKQIVNLKEGISKEKAKEIVKLIKGTKLKVQPSIQGDSVRVTGKKRDDLQEAIAFLKQADIDLPLSYNNFRD